MNNLKSVFLILSLIVGCVLSASAQKHPERTSSGMAAYGRAPEPAKYKSQKVKKVRKKVPNKAPRAKEVKTARTKRSAPAYRKRANWAS
jgi:hypothetical protein